MKLAGQIIVGYDDSDGARRALRTVCELADPRSVVTVIHAIDAPPHLTSFKSFESACLELAQQFENSAKELVGNTEPRVNYLSVVGKPADVLAEAGRRPADVIVVGSRGLGPVRSAISSVTQKLLQRASCPVLVIPESSDDVQTKVPAHRLRPKFGGAKNGSAALVHS